MNLPLVHIPIVTSPTHNASRLRLFSGLSNQKLSRDVANSLGLSLSPVTIKKFADGEIYVRLDESVRGCDTFLIQPTCCPVNDNLIQLLIMIDACKRASAKTVNAVIPYFGYARSDRKTESRESISAKLVANLITKAGADRVISVDLHSGQCVGYFDIPVDHIQGNRVIVDYLTSKRMKNDNIVVVSPDIGGVGRARCFAKLLNGAPLAIVDKRRHAHNDSTVMNVIGDVIGKTAILVDDIVDTAGTITNAAVALRQKGALSVIACATHGVLSKSAIEKLSSGVFDEVILTNTIPVSPEKYFDELTLLSVGDLIGNHVMKVYNSNI